MISLLAAGGMVVNGMAQTGLEKGPAQERADGGVRQEGVGPPPPGRSGEGPPRPDSRGKGPGGERHGPPGGGGFGGKSMGGRPPMWGDGFEKLSDDEKRRVREALGKAWGRPEVSAARDRLMVANEEMRRAIHEAVKEIDPEIAKVLAKMRGPEGFGGRGEPPKLPDVASADFPQEVVKRLEAELMMFTPPERRDEVRKVHARLLETPAIRDAVARLNAAAIDDRIRAMEDLRKVYREGVSQEIRRSRNHTPGGNDGGPVKRAPDEGK
jgi:hypothetical protein